MTNLVQFPALGLELEINRVAFSIGNFNIYWYGLLIGSGMLLALMFAFAKARSFGIDDDKLVDVVFVTTIVAVICARAYYVAFAPFKYNSFWDAINIRDGGLAIYGAVIGAAVFGTFMCKWRKIPVLATLDIAAMGFLIGQGVGRWGNFFNQEAFGTNTESLFGMYSPSTKDYLTAVQMSLVQQGIVVDPMMPVHPTFLYESVWCLVGFAFLAFYIKHRRFDGEIAVIYAAWYGLGRFFIEGIRTDSLMTSFFNLRTSQIVAAVSVIGGIILWMFMNKHNKGVTPPLAAKNSKEQPAMPVVANEVIAQAEPTQQQEVQTTPEENEPSTEKTIPAENATPAENAEQEAHNNGTNN